MRKEIFSQGRRIAVASCIALLAGCAMMGNQSSMVYLGGTMTGAQEVPPATTQATGAVNATYDKWTNKLSYEIDYSRLTGPATAGHFHGPASPGQNAGVVLPFSNAMSPIRGEAKLTAAQAADLLAGRWYANIHTARYPGGEIRGQVTVR